MTRATAPTFLLLISPMRLWASVAGASTCTRSAVAVHLARQLCSRDAVMTERRTCDEHGGARSGRESSAGQIADGVVAGVPHYPRVLRRRVRGRHHDRGVDRYQTRRCRGAAAGAPLVEGHGGAGGGRRGVGDRAVVCDGPVEGRPD